jgi:hypothetical protein
MGDGAVGRSSEEAMKVSMVDLERTMRSRLSTMEEAMLRHCLRCAVGRSAVSLALVIGLTAAGCGPSASTLPDGADQPDAGTPDTPDARDSGSACIPRLTPRGVTGLDASGRILNTRGIHLVDWDGFLANAAETITLRPPADIAFPATATLTADHPRLYFNLPSSVSATGPRKTVQFDSAHSTVVVRLGGFPDRDGADEHYRLTVMLGGDDPRVETIPITVHDQDRNLALLTRITVDFANDQTGFLASEAGRNVVRQAADDWSYFLDDMQLDIVPAMDESTFIWDPTGFISGRVVQNAAPYVGFLEYAYGIHSAELRSGGEGSHLGKLATSEGTELPLRRSGGIEIETQGNYNTLGWIVDLEPDNWWKSGNFGNEQNDLYSIVHHEIGHSHGFNGAYPQFVAAQNVGLTSPAILAYHGAPLAFDRSDHFAGTVDPASGFGAFGNEYNGQMPARRWIITRADVLALEPLGYKLRALVFERWVDAVPDCP